MNLVHAIGVYGDDASITSRMLGSYLLIFCVSCVCMYIVVGVCGMDV